jgi:hypothetical protein
VTPAAARTRAVLRAALAAAAHRVARGTAVTAASSNVPSHHVLVRFAVSIDTAHMMAYDTDRIAKIPRRTFLGFA